MCAASDEGVVIHDGSAVDQHAVLHCRMCVDDGILHDKAAVSDHCAWAYHCGRMDDRRHLVTCLHQFFGPVQAHIVVA